MWALTRGGWVYTHLVVDSKMEIRAKMSANQLQDGKMGESFSTRFNGRPMAGSRCASLILAFGLGLSLFGQSGNGSVQGTVKDTTGAVIAGAKVTLVHSETARRFDTAANEVGFYLLPSIPPGSYKIAVESPGMQAWQGELVLQTGQRAVVDVVLNVAPALTQVTVAGDVTPLVTMDSPVLGNVLERARLEQLPLNGRFFNNLVALTTPGIEGAKVYGLRNAMQFVQDGAVLEQSDGGGGAPNTRPPGLDTIQEVRVETNNSSARMSRPATTIVSTKSGTNQLHGSAFETARNNGLGVARARQDYYRKPPHLVRNEFGASLGGPVYLPRLYNGRNRTFFFGAYEAYRNMASSTISATMPTAAMRQGDFSGLVDQQGRRITLYDPWTTDGRTWQRQPFPGNRIPPARESPMAKRLLAVTPQPTNADNPLVAPNYFGEGPNNRRDHTETFRGDHRLTDHDQIFARFTYGYSLSYSVEQTRKVPPLLDGSANLIYIPNQDVTAVVSWTHTFSPTFFGETLVTGSQEDWRVDNTLTSRPNLVDELGLPNPFQNPYIANYSTKVGFTMDYFTQEPRHGINRNITLDQNLTKIRGRHEFQFGGRIRYNSLDILSDQPRLTTQFDSLATSLYDPASGSAYGAVPRTGHESANFFLGIANSYSTSLIRQWYHLRVPEYSVYLQDNLKVSSRLTLNLGLRYEAYPPMTERDRLMAGFDPNTKAIILGTSLDQMYKMGATTSSVVAEYRAIGVKFITAKEAGLPDTLIYGNWLDFNPRVGFAYRIPGGYRSTVLRGGYSVFGYATSTRTFTQAMRQNPPMSITRTYTLNSAAQAPDGLPNYGLRSVPAVIAGLNSRTLLDQPLSGANLRGAFGIRYFSPHQPTMRAHEWNFTLEREVMKGTVVRASFVGTHGSRLDQYFNLNDPPTNYVWFVSTGLPLPTGEYANVARRPFENTAFGPIQEYRKAGWSNANSFKLEAERRYAGGYGFELFYVMTNAFRAGGNSRYDDAVPPAESFLPGAVPTDPQARNRFLNYRRDAELPKHRLRWNWLVDLPFGRSKKLGRNAGPVLDRVIGGWQIAGFGNLNSRYFQLPTSWWGPIGKVEIYGKKYPIQDCRSGTCYPGYLYWNGYIPANRINSYAADGKPNGAMGVPANYVPATRPVIPIPADGGSRSDPLFAYYDTNTVWVQLKDGSLQRVAFDTGLHPWRNQYVAGPWIWSLDASLFKSIPIRESVALRFNADFFNVLNMPGTPMPGADGLISLRYSAQAPRQLQLTLRLTW